MHSQLKVKGKKKYKGFFLVAKNETRGLWLILSQYYSPFSSRNCSFHNKEVISGYLINCRIPAQCQHHSSSSRHGKLGSPTNTIRLQATKSWLQLQFQDFLTQKLPLNYRYFICRNTSPPWICISLFSDILQLWIKKRMFSIFLLEMFSFGLDHPLILKTKPKNKTKQNQTNKQNKTKPHCAL